MCLRGCIVQVLSQKVDGAYRGVCVYSSKTYEEDSTEERERSTKLTRSARTCVFNDTLVLKRDVLPDSREPKDPKIQRRGVGTLLQRGRVEMEW